MSVGKAVRQLVGRTLVAGRVGSAVFVAIGKETLLLKCATFTVNICRKYIIPQKSEKSIPNANLVEENGKYEKIQQMTEGEAPPLRL